MNQSMNQLTKSPLPSRNRFLLASAIASAVLLLQTGCAVIAVADAAVSVGATVVKVGAKTVGAAVDLVLPDSDSDKKAEEKK